MILAITITITFIILLTLNAMVATIQVLKKIYIKIEYVSKVSEKVPEKYMYIEKRQFKREEIYHDIRIDESMPINYPSDYFKHDAIHSLLRKAYNIGAIQEQANRDPSLPPWVKEKRYSLNVLIPLR